MPGYHEDQPEPDGEPGIESQAGGPGRLQPIGGGRYLAWPPDGGQPVEVTLEMLASAEMALGERVGRARRVGEAATDADGDEQPRPRMSIADHPDLKEPYL